MTAARISEISSGRAKSRWWSLKPLAFVLGVAVLACSVPATAQRGGPPGGMMGNSYMGLLNDQKVTSELELVEDQVDSIRELQKDARDIFRESFSGMREKFRAPDVDREALMAEIQDKIREEMKSVDEKISEILLPHQMDRLKEISFQAESQRGGTQGLLNNEKMKEALNITEEQLEQVKAKAAEVQEALQKKIEQAREDAQQEILSVLTPEQQAKIKELLGESFKFEERRGWGGRGGDRGGRGGDRGRRGGPGGGGPDGGDRGRGGRGGPGGVDRGDG